MSSIILAKSWLDLLLSITYMYFLLLETGIDTPFSLYFQYNLPLAFGQVAKGILSNLVKVKKKMLSILF